MKLLELIDRDLYSEIIAHSMEELSAAAEIFIAETYARTYYNQILNKNDFPGLLGSQQFVAWINDHTGRTGKTRPGLLRLYIADNPSHFKKEKWLTIYLPVAMAYARDKMQDKSYVKRGEVRLLAARSFADEEWLRRATGLFGVKMLEFLARHKALRTEAARAVVEANQQFRTEVKEFTAVLFRARKDGLPDHAFRRLEDMIQRTVPTRIFGDVLRKIRAESGFEYRQYLRLKPRLEGLLREVARQSALLLPGEQATLDESQPGLFF
ncbi:hypothetical protein EDD75_0415 [Thermodesulfitimonas autotrophica]|uniref:Uncharacterized protein n=1 Tax=Thermodesulfitimonas autotrophica TaxID=1894989 RepID=A0A3N5AXD4_9THEO|nr:hypothetical protein [Thermodesulfitimonas autotrophica]RPF49597.1 hypothetical protein EDD75_0415 [Thermodesulfitimonas autotrophica]